MPKTTLAVYAHVDAGKTTFSEQLLYHGGRLRDVGRVDHKNTSLDHHEIERKRGITVFADQSDFSVGDLKVYLIDTPGHVDFSAEMQRSVWACDYALILVDATDGVKGHTKTVYDLLQKQGIPTMFFLNKTDRPNADTEAMMEQLARLTGLTLIHGVGITSPDDAFKEQLCNVEPDWMEHYFADDQPDAFWQNAAKERFLQRELFPVFAGSALFDAGVKEFIHTLPLWLTPSNAADSDKPFAAKVYRLTRDKAGMRRYYLKIESGRLRARDSIMTPSGEQKIGEIRQCFGAKLTPVEAAEAGDIVTVSGITVPVGSVLGDASCLNRPMLPVQIKPLMKSAVIYDKALPLPKVLADFNELAEEDPSLQTAYAAQTGEISVCTMGEVQLEILQSIVEERFGYTVRFGESVPLYRETILAPVYGCGHYEPLRHYAEVHLRIDPMPKGSGIHYASECSLERLGQNDQNLILTMLRETDKLGVLIGAPVDDLKITLLTGATHLKHTEGGDLKQAACRALRQGLMKAQSVLCEPWCKFSIRIPTSLLGRIITDCNQMNAVLNAPTSDESGEMSEITGRVAAAQLFAYPKILAAVSGGKGSMQSEFDGYERCTAQGQEQAIKAANYSPVADVDHSPDSIFCSHGAGFLVHWQDADGYMHCSV